MYSFKKYLHVRSLGRWSALLQRENEPRLHNGNWFQPDINLCEWTSNINNTVNSVDTVKAKNDLSNSADLLKAKKSHSLLPSEAEKQRINELKDSLSSATSLQFILSAYAQNKPSFDTDLYVFIIRAISHLYKAGVISSHELKENEGFANLCYDVWKTLPQMESYMVLSTYKSFLDMEMNTSYLIMQSLLQMMRHQINLFTARELLLLFTLLSKTGDCELKRALQRALPVVLDNSLNSHFPKMLKFNDYMRLLQICIRGELSSIGPVLRHIKNSALPELLSKSEDGGNVEAEVISLITNLIDFFVYNNRSDRCDGHVEVARLLLLLALDKLTESDLANVEQPLVTVVLTKLSSGCELGIPEAYDENFNAKICRKAIREQWDAASLIQVIRLQFKMRYINEELIECALSHLTREEPFVQNHQVDITSLVGACAASYQPSLAQTLERLTRNFVVPPDRLQVPWIKFALDLLWLNHCPKNIFEVILNKDFLLRYLNYGSNGPQGALDVLRLHRVLQTKPWDNEGLYLPSEVLEKAYELRREPPTACLRGLLKSIIGHEFKSNVMTPRGSNIDHFIVVDGDGRPTNVSAEGGETECKKIAVIEVPNTWTCGPGLKIRGSLKWELRLLHDEGLHVVPLYLKQLQTGDSAAVAELVTQHLREAGVVCFRS